MKAEVSIGFQAVFAVLISMLILIILIPRVSGPVLQTYSAEAVNVTAHSLAANINSLTVMESGTIDKVLVGEWDVSAKKAGDNYFLEVTHFDNETNREYSTTVQLLGPAEGNAYETRRVMLTKEAPGEPVKIARKTI